MRQVQRALIFLLLMTGLASCGSKSAESRGSELMAEKERLIHLLADQSAGIGNLLANNEEDPGLVPASLEIDFSGLCGVLESKRSVSHNLAELKRLVKRVIIAHFHPGFATESEVLSFESEVLSFESEVLSFLLGDLGAQSFAKALSDQVLKKTCNTQAIKKELQDEVSVRMEVVVDTASRLAKVVKEIRELT